MTIDIPVGNYHFVFRKLKWREEFALQTSIDKDIRKVILAHGLVSISGLILKSVEEALAVVRTLPRPIMDRVFILYRGELPANKKFQIGPLYKAPEPSDYASRLKKDEAERESKIDKVLEKTSEADREIMRKARSMPGVTRVQVVADEQ